MMPGVRNWALRVLGPLALAVTASACQPTAGGPASAASHAGLAFAKSACGGCHAVEQRSVSPNPGAPPFARIVNQQGVTRNTLAAWLRDAHNYPSEMNFTLDGRKVDDLVAYMLTLRDPNYRPEI
jgi:mono/diheme cytochrome c family protein